VTAFKVGLVHAPLTPFSNGRIDFDSYGKLLDFHVHNGAEGLAISTHTGESVSLTVDERKTLLEFTLKHVRGQTPVIAGVSESGTEIAASLAAHARQAGAAALMVSVPYYWTPPQSMLLEHFAAVGTAAGELPLFVYNSPSEMGEVEVATKTALELIDRLPNFAGLIDASLDWQFMIELVSLARNARSNFQFVSGTEYMISARAIGATGLLTSLSNISPRVVRELYDLCREEKYEDARSRQFDLAVMCRLFRGIGVSGLKAATRFMGRDCGVPRPPLPTFTEAESRALTEKLSAIDVISAEPKGWR
jgi:4-hydroxy-tetrahydrodipicolinate synthase